MSTFNVILCPVDQSEHSDRAVRYAGDLASLGGGVVHLLHVREREVVHSKFSGSFELETNDEVESLLAKEIGALRSADVKVTAQVLRGRVEDTARAIVDVAGEISADVIVMGTRGLTAFGALMLGSTTYKVLHSATCPVVVVP